MVYRIAFLGPPGSGKGTQAARLAPVINVPIIGPGTLYRKEIASGTELGKHVAAVVESGGMVPNAITNAIIAERLRQPDCASGFILDGYPRELEQATALDAAAEPLTHAILLTIDAAEAVARLSERLICTCGKAFNRKELAIEHGDEARCDACDGALERRRDDDPESIERRIAHYRAQTEPVIAEYRRRGVLVEVNGQRPIADVHADICARLGIGVGS